ncbi:hypothetical protein SRABI106_02991 [Rahnella aquatilis]|nr:hypothetical protein SRABI106_02991 [Rahnella aquatilis]
MIKRVAKHFPVACDQCVDQHKTAVAGNLSVEAEIQPSGTADPAQPGVKHQQAHHADPEYRGGITRQADDAHHIIRDAVAFCRRQHTERNADARTENDRQRRQFHGGREHAQNVLRHRFTGQQRIAQIAMRQPGKVNTELRPQRFIKAELMVNLLIGAVVGVRSDNRQHRIHRHHAADKKRQQQQSEQRDRYLHQTFADAPGRE